MVRKVVAPASASVRAVVPRARNPKSRSIPPPLGQPGGAEIKFPPLFSGASLKVATCETRRGAGHTPDRVRFGGAEITLDAAAVQPLSTALRELGRVR